MKTLIILFLCYVLFRILRFFFRAFMVLLQQRKLMKQMMQQMKQQQRPQRPERKNGDVVIEYVSDDKQRQKEKPKSDQGGDYIDYEIIK